jgi:HEAT repeat protein
MKGGRGSLFREMLAVGDLRSDGLAAEVAGLVAARPDLLDDLMAVLSDPSPAVRGHAADALERVSRRYPDRVERYLRPLLSVSATDGTAMVRWHVAMILANVTRSAATARRATPVLLALLDDPSAFVRSWAVSGLCLIGRRFDEFADGILPAVKKRSNDRSIAVRHRAATAIRLLVDPEKPVPRSWIKVPSTVPKGAEGTGRG